MQCEGQVRDVYVVDLFIPRKKTILLIILATHYSAVRICNQISVVSAPASSEASVEVALQSVFAAQAELLRSELRGMASVGLKEAAQPLRDVANSMQGWLLRVVSFLERAEAALVDSLLHRLWHIPLLHRLLCLSMWSLWTTTMRWSAAASPHVLGPLR